MQCHCMTSVGTPTIVDPCWKRELDERSQYYFAPWPDEPPAALQLLPDKHSKQHCVCVANTQLCGEEGAADVLALEASLLLKELQVRTLLWQVPMASKQVRRTGTPACMPAE